MYPNFIVKFFVTLVTFSKAQPSLLINFNQSVYIYT